MKRTVSCLLLLHPISSYFLETQKISNDLSLNGKKVKGLPNYCKKMQKEISKLPRRLLLVLSSCHLIIAAKISNNNEMFNLAAACSSNTDSSLRFDSTITTTTTINSDRRNLIDKQGQEQVGNDKNEDEYHCDESVVITDDTTTIGNDDPFTAEASFVNIFTPAAPKPVVQDNGEDMGVVQLIDVNRSNEVIEVIQRARDYLTNQVAIEDKYDKVRNICKNNHEHCAFWSLTGECEKNPAYMQVNCGPVCQSCEMLHVETRCPIDENAVNAFAEPGDVNKMFERIVNSPEFQQFEPVIVSQPPRGPWLLLFENVLSEEEAERLIELGGIRGYERSADVGQEKEDGTYTLNINGGRTSTNAWCVEECMEDPIAQRVVQRIENITGIPSENSENLQLLRYEQDQFYQTHSDYIPYQVNRPSGVRILTFYMYLNDVEEGGGTNFPILNVTVTPKRGRAALWPSVLDRNPNKKDFRTNHQAMPVIKGVKYGANGWIHQRDFQTPNKNGCT